MNFFDFFMRCLLTPTVPFHAYKIWRELRVFNITYWTCVNESWMDLWCDEEDDDYEG